MVCNITFTPDFDMINPKIYYRLENFYANHRNFVKSRNFKQLRGEESTDLDLTNTCSSMLKNKDLKESSFGKISTSINGMPLNDDEFAQPCGLIARYFFNDSF